jgi:hypothetical protein
VCFVLGFKYSLVFSELFFSYSHWMFALDFGSHFFPPTDVPHNVSFILLTCLLMGCSLALGGRFV